MLTPQTTGIWVCAALFVLWLLRDKIARAIFRLRLKRRSLHIGLYVGRYYTDILRYELERYGLRVNPLKPEIAMSIARGGRWLNRVTLDQPGLTLVVVGYSETSIPLDYPTGDTESLQLNFFYPNGATADPTFDRFETTAKGPYPSQYLIRKAVRAILGAAIAASRVQPPPDPGFIHDPETGRARPQKRSSYSLHWISPDEISPILFDQLRRLWAEIGWAETRVRSNELWTECLCRSRDIVSVWDGNTLIGFGRVVEDGIFATFYDIAVDPQYQRQGIGTQIMEALISRVKDRNYAGIQLFRWDKNPGNLSFYEGLGFVPSDTGMELLRYMSPE